MKYLVRFQAEETIKILKHLLRLPEFILVSFESSLFFNTSAYQKIHSIVSVRFGFVITDAEVTLNVLVSAQGSQFHVWSDSLAPSP